MTDNHGKSRFRSAFRDAVLFGRVISAGLVVAGYAFAGVYLARDSSPGFTGGGHYS